MKARQQTFIDQYFHHILALGLAVSATLVIMALFFVKPLPSLPSDITAGIQDAENSNAQTFTLPPELVETPMPDHSMSPNMKMTR